MRRRVVSAAMAAMSGVILAAALAHAPLNPFPLRWFTALSLTFGVVLFAISVLLFLTTFDQGRSAAILRLDWYGPVLRRLTTRRTASYALPGRLLRRLIPVALQSDRATKRRGLIRRTLRRMGISWLASPFRRVVQAGCLAAFFVLFFVVCWPYDARPKSPGARFPGWEFQEFDQQTGDLMLAGTISGETSVRAGDILFAVDAGSSGRPQMCAGSFQVGSFSGHAIRLIPHDELTPEAFDAFFTSNGPWTLHADDPAAWHSHYADNLARKEVIPAEFFLLIDPLVSISTAVASRSWVWSLVSAAAILLVCALVPRGFCGYLCPLGTTIDLFDWAVGKRVARFRFPDGGWWVHIKYYLLAGTLICAVFGVLVSGYFAAIPVITRGMLFAIDPIQNGSVRGWHLVPSMNSGHFISLVLFAAVLCLGFLRPRFWCKYVCPSGAVFSLANVFRLTERKVESSCINCNKCVEICPFDAIKPDYTTRTTDCTMCESCGGVCPTEAIKFVERWNFVELKTENDPSTNETALGRRGFLSLAGGSAAAVAGGLGLAGITKTFGANLHSATAFRPVRPPGSVPEQQFLQMCIRCGECFKACPNNVLQPEGFQQGLEGLWSPMVVADWAGCESSCNACGQVCPTGAIRSLPLEEKKAARMGLAIVNETTCLPFAGREACDLCVQECNAAGYDAIEFTQVGVQTDRNGAPVEGTGYQAPVVLADRCVGCGLCQTRCHAINVRERKLLSDSAIIIAAGDGREDRLMHGSYVQRRIDEQAAATDVLKQPSETEYFVPDSGIAPASSGSSPVIDTDDPFGISADQH
ncbi:MAG: 4Fe-4S binding protein [Planctomycetaceae bacterium]